MKNILSIDGGGIRSYIPLRMLNYIENKTQIPISELFDYFSGVSAGAIVISWVLIKNEHGLQKYSTNQILDMFENLCAQIFPSSYSNKFKTGFGLFGSKYDCTNITKCLENVCGDTKPEDLIKPFTILSYDLISNRPYYFKKTKNDDVYLKDILRATTSAPSFFDPHHIKINSVDYVLIDGGIISCSPIKTCFIDAYDHYNINGLSHNFYTLSLGTGFFDVVYNKDDKNNNGFIFWYKKILEIFLSGSADELNEEVRLIGELMQGNIAKRLDVNVNKYIQLDDVSCLPILKNIMDIWIENNTELLDTVCSELLVNYINNKISNI